MNARTRPLTVGALRAFEAVARRLRFRAAAEELHLTQPAISRQIQALEHEIGCTLFARGTRSVKLTDGGEQLQGAVLPLLGRLDACVQQLREQGQRPVIQLTTFASLASLWLLPRLEAFQRQHPDLDIRIAASDQLHDLASNGFDLALSYQLGTPSGSAEWLFDEVLSPVHSPARAARIAAGDLKPLRRPQDLAEHTLAEEDDPRPSSQLTQWRHWFSQHGLEGLQARRWLRLNFTYQQVQAALAGQALALARLPLVDLHLQRGELIETFGEQRRLAVPTAYWLRMAPGALELPGVAQFVQWLLCEAAATRERVGAVQVERARHKGPPVGSDRPAAAQRRTR